MLILDLVLLLIEAQASLLRESGAQALSPTKPDLLLRLVQFLEKHHSPSTNTQPLYSLLEETVSLQNLSEEEEMLLWDSPTYRAIVESSLDLSSTLRIQNLSQAQELIHLLGACLGAQERTQLVLRTRVLNKLKLPTLQAL